MMNNQIHNFKKPFKYQNAILILNNLFLYLFLMLENYFCSIWLKQIFSTLKAKIQSFQLFDADLLSRENQSQNRERVFARNLHQKSSVKCPDNDHPGPAW